MKKRASLTLIVFMILITTFHLSACNQPIEEKIADHWVCEEGKDNYPDTMNLYSNGSGVVDGEKCSWEIKGNQLHISSLAHQYTPFCIGFDSIGVNRVLYLNGYRYDVYDSNTAHPTTSIRAGSYHLIGGDDVNERITLVVYDDGQALLSGMGESDSQLQFDENNGTVREGVFEDPYDVYGNTIIIHYRTGETLYKKD